MAQPNDERHIRRLESSLQRWEAVSRRYSWLRLGVVLAGGLLIWAAAPAGLGLPMFGAAVLLFSTLVWQHRRVDHWIETLRARQEMARQRAARLALDWAHIPLPPGPELRSPLAVDLDLTGPRSLHHLLDAAVSRQGSRRLAEWLTCGAPDLPAIASRQAVVGELAALPRLRTRLGLTFRLLSREPLDGEALLGWLQTPLPERALAQTLPWVSLLSLATAILFVLNSAGRLPPLWIASLLAYILLYFSRQGLVSEFMAAVLRLDRELDKFQPLLRLLETYPYGSRASLKAQCAVFCQPASRPSGQLRAVKLVTSLAGLRMNQLLGPLLNLALPWDFWVAWLAARRRRRLESLLPAWLEAFHTLEALASLADFAAQHPAHAFPAFIPLPGQPGAPVLRAQQLGHPLIPAARKVRNDLQIEALGDLLLITGSNMSGKSTFLRTVGANLCLAYAGGPVDAAALQTAPFRLYTCIRINDSLDDGFSFFYAEVKRLKGLLDALRSPTAGQPLLYLIDEIFRGTNNRERLVGSRAYLKALIGAPGVGLIATHDLELGLQARNLHFSDRVEQGRLVFDYRLRPGLSPSTNALQIMALEGLPVEDA